MTLLRDTRPGTLYAVLVAAGLVLCAPFTAQAATAAFSSKSDPDSFVPIPAPTVQSLLSQVQTNPVVRSRYAHHFHIPDSHLLAYLRANLVASHLSDDGRYTMFCVRPNGLVYPTVLTMTRGSRVFALRGGPAILTCPEGNPLTRFQMAVETRVVPLAVNPRAETKPAAPHQTVTPVQERDIIVPAYVPTPVYQAVSPLTPAERTDEPQPTPPASTPAKP